MRSDYEVLSTEQAEHFVERGFVVIHDCFTAEDAARFTDSVWARLGYDPDDQTTWTESSVHMPEHRRVDVRTFAPRAWRAACELAGGEDRISTRRPYQWNDSFIVNLWEGADRPWEPASPSAPGWHKDGDFFRHYLDSPEQGLLSLVLWSPVRHQGGATFVAADSVGPVARFLAEHPEGAIPKDVTRDPTVGGPEPVIFPYPRLIGECHDFVEATGEIGDVYLIHPFVLHAKAQNVLRLPRVITNPPLTLAEPMNLDRPDPDDFSLIERAVLRGLGVDRYGFTPAGPREEVVPLRVARQRQMKLEEEARLGR